MQSVKPLLLVLLTYSLLSCAPTNPAPTRMGDEKTTDCGEIPIGVTIDKRELDLAGATMASFSLGKLEVKDTPQFQKIISEAASNSAATDVLVCKAIARAGVRGNPEMVDYFTRMTHFFARQPSISEQLQWRQTNPFPKVAAQGQSNLSKGSGSPPSIAMNCVPVIIPLLGSPGEFLYAIYLDPRWGNQLAFTPSASWPPGATPNDRAYRCEVVNNGVLSLNGLSVVFTATFREGAGLPPKREIAILSPVSVEPQHSVTFHIADDTKRAQEVTPPESVSARVGDEKERRTISVSYSTVDGRPVRLRGFNP